MRKFLTAAIAATALSTAAHAAVITETESNDTFATANLLDGFFDRAYSADIGDSFGNTSTAIPHVTVNAFSEANGRDTFRFTVGTAGSRGIFDVDYALNYHPSGFDANLALYDTLGNLLTGNDDSNTGNGAGGSFHSFDSYVEYTFAIPGAYFIQVGRCCFNQQFPGPGNAYQLQVSLENPAGVPEPAPLALVGLGIAGLAYRRRRG